MMTVPRISAASSAASGQCSGGTRHSLPRHHRRQRHRVVPEDVAPRPLPLKLDELGRHREPGKLSFHDELPRVA